MQERNLRTARMQLAQALMDIGAVLTRDDPRGQALPNFRRREGTAGPEYGFWLKLHEESPTAPLSPIFLNLRTPDNPKPGPLTPEIVHAAAECMHLLAFQRELNYSLVTGLPNAGTPLAHAFGSISFKTPVLELVKEDRGDGKRRIAGVKGSIKAGQRVLVLDDLVTEAHSKFEGIEVIEADDGIVQDVVVLVDREQGGRQELEGRGYQLHAVFTMTELLELYVTMRTLSEAFVSEVKAYLATYR